MSDSLPWVLFFVYAAVNGAIFLQHDFIRRTEFFGRPMAPMPLRVSAALGGLVLLGTHVHYFVMTPWYWTFVLLALGSFAGGIGGGIFRSLLGVAGSLSASFIIWPVFAIWLNAIIADL